LDFELSPDDDPRRQEVGARLAEAGWAVPTVILAGSEYWTRAVQRNIVAERALGFLGAASLPEASLG
jgi:hypothetical protein